MSKTNTQQFDFQLFTTITSHFSIIQLKGETTEKLTAQLFTLSGKMIKEFDLVHQHSFSQNPVSKGQKEGVMKLLKEKGLFF